MSALFLVSVKQYAPEGVRDLTGSIVSDGLTQSVKLPMPIKGEIRLNFVTPKKELQ